MRMRKKKHLEERLAAASSYLYTSDSKQITCLGRLTPGEYRIKISAETPYGIQSEYIEKTIKI